ncbi:MAG: Rpn family recombination-promoting nuclease/putative transposase [Acetatifactor sp.]|nr:Rpn family recombination-promoting nuclease/putative transposase [Acetatifactor sp.]
MNHSVLIFPEIQPLPQVLGDSRLRADVLLQIQNDPGTYAIFQSFTSQEQEAFLGFCMGERGLKVTYDPFFKHIFNPESHPDRLNRLLSCILGQEITVRKVLPLERRRISENSSLIIMDILVQLADGRLVNVEMQRVGYDFPIERSFCYGADLLVRQYDVAREDQGKDFSYHSIRPVYVIVLMEESPRIFYEHSGKYIHRSRISFDTGLKMNPLQNIIYISLDIFRGMKHNKLTELEAWLYFLSSDDPADILRIVRSYPIFQELYQDIVNFRFQPKELISMYSEALRIMDQNTVNYMIDELKAELSAQKAAVLQKDSEIERLRTQLAKYEAHTNREDSG